MRKFHPGALAFAATGLLALATPILVFFSDITVAPQFLGAVVGAVVVLQILAIRYRKQDEKPLLGAIHGASMLMAFTTLYAIAQYTLPEHSSGFWDEAFASIDAAVGITAPAVVQFARDRPWLDQGLSKIYYAFFFHFALFVPYSSGVRRDWYRTYEGLAQMFFAAIIGLVLFALFPAKNAVWFYGFDDIHGTLMIVEHLQALQDATFGTLTQGNAQGLIQFPSFHMAIALILWWDLRHEPPAVWAFGTIWTALMGISAVTTGGHYVVDVYGGILIAVAAVVLVAALSRPRREDEFQSPIIPKRSKVHS